MSKFNFQVVISPDSYNGIQKLRTIVHLMQSFPNHTIAEKEKLIRADYYLENIFNHNTYKNIELTIVLTTSDATIYAMSDVNISKRFWRMRNTTNGMQLTFDTHNVNLPIHLIANHTSFDTHIIVNNLQYLSINNLHKIDTFIADALQYKSYQNDFFCKSFIEIIVG